MADRACAAIFERGQLLMVRQTYRGATVWTFPGGRIEPHERPEAAAIRETKEETGLDVLIVRLLYTGPRTTGQGIYYCFLARVVGGTPALGRDPELAPDAQELHELRWFRLEELRQHPEVERVRHALL
jgi:8-oxo-dGTP diphosphatase